MLTNQFNNMLIFCMLCSHDLHIDTFGSIHPELISEKLWIPISNIYSFAFCIQLTLVILNSMGPWKKFESTIVRLKRSYENTGSVVCLTTKGRQLERNFEELKPASHVPILGTIFKHIRCFCCCFFLSVKFFESCGTTDNF